MWNTAMRAIEHACSWDVPYHGPSCKQCRSTQRTLREKHGVYPVPRSMSKSPRSCNMTLLVTNGRCALIDSYVDLMEVWFGHTIIHVDLLESPRGVLDCRSVVDDLIQYISDSKSVYKGTLQVVMHCCERGEHSRFLTHFETLWNCICFDAELACTLMQCRIRLICLVDGVHLDLHRFVRDKDRYILFQSTGKCSLLRHVQSKLIKNRRLRIEDLQKLACIQSVGRGVRGEYLFM